MLMSSDAHLNICITCSNSLWQIYIRPMLHACMLKRQTMIMLSAVMISGLHKCKHVLQYMLNQIIHYIDIIFLCNLITTNMFYNEVIVSQFHKLSNKVISLYAVMNMHIDPVNIKLVLLKHVACNLV